MAQFQFEVPHLLLQVFYIPLPGHPRHVVRSSLLQIFYIPLSGHLRLFRFRLLHLLCFRNKIV